MNPVKYLKKYPLLNRKKSDPDKFIYTGEKAVEKIDFQLFKYNKDECTETIEISHSDIESFDDDNYIYWLNIYGLNEPDSIAEICNKLKIHSLVIQDILDVNQRPKFQEFDDFSFLTIKSIVPSSSEMITEQISFIIGKNYLVSFQEKKADYFEHLRFRLRENKGILRERGTDYLLYTLIESILDNYFKTLERLDNEVENLNFLNDKADPAPGVLEVIENNKKFVHFIKKSILPIKDFIVTIEREEIRLIEYRHLKYFYEIKDLCLTLLDTCDTLLSSLESSINLFFYVQGHRMNQVMKTLTIVAAIFIPLTFIAGIYGMNFSNMPELKWKYGYAAVWILILIIVIGMISYFKKRKWF